jgi:hypothetical protein
LDIDEVEVVDPLYYSPVDVDAGVRERLLSLATL